MNHFQWPKIKSLSNHHVNITCQNRRWKAHISFVDFNLFMASNLQKQIRWLKFF